MLCGKNNTRATSLSGVGPDPPCAGAGVQILFLPFFLSGDLRLPKPTKPKKKGKRH